MNRSAFWTLIPFALTLPLGAEEQNATGTKDKGRAPLRIEAFTGSTGATVQEMLEKDLQQAGTFDLNSPLAEYVATGEATAGKLLGALKNSKGTVVFRQTYDSYDLRSNAHQFSDDISTILTGRVGISNTKIVFVSTFNGNKEIYMVDSDGGNLRQLTNDGGINVSPAISSNGGYVAYTTYAAGYADVVVVDLQSGQKRTILNSPGTNSGAAFSPDGSQMAATMSFSGNPEIYVVAPKGGHARRITKDPAVDCSPAWSADGDSLVYCSDATGRPQLYIKPLSGGQSVRIPTGFVHCTEPSCSPDGTRIAFTVKQSGGMSIAIYDLETGRSSILTEGESPCWGADGSHLVYSVGNALVIHQVDTGVKRRIATNFGRVTEPSWSR